MLNKSFLRAAGGLADTPCAWRVNRPSAEIVVDSFQLYFGCGWKKSSDFLDRFRNENKNGRAHSVGEHLQRFHSARSYRAHALSSVAQRSLSQLDMFPKDLLQWSSP